MEKIKKIVIIGPESTGKSSLCKKLSEYYKTEWCPEYAREYLIKNGTEYNYDDLLMIAKGQLALEEEYTKKVSEKTITGSSSLLFLDTDLYVMKVWCEYVYGKCHTFILDQIVKQTNSLYLLCNIDLPWAEDELREYPDLKSREELYNIYKDIMINQSTPWVEISGNYEERVNKAIKAIDELII